MSGANGKREKASRKVQKYFAIRSNLTTGKSLSVHAEKVIAMIFMNYESDDARKQSKNIVE